MYSYRSCDRTSAARIRCPNHEKCTNQCRQAIDGLSVLLHEENGLLYCENCIAFTCEHCNCRLTVSLVVDVFLNMSKCISFSCYF